MSDRQTPPSVEPDTNIEPLVVFDEDALIWIVTCPTTACSRTFAEVRLSVALRRYAEHRDLPTFSTANITADLLAV
jgi:hypothetical protein